MDSGITVFTHLLLSMNAGMDTPHRTDGYTPAIVIKVIHINKKLQHAHTNPNTTTFPSEPLCHPSPPIITVVPLLWVPLGTSIYLRHPLCMTRCPPLRSNTQFLLTAPTSRQTELPTWTRTTILITISICCLSPERTALSNTCLSQSKCEHACMLLHMFRDLLGSSLPAMEDVTRRLGHRVRRKAAHT